MTELHDLLHRATDQVPDPDLAGRALAVAHRRRTRRRGAAAVLATAAAVAVVAVSVQLTSGETRSDEPPATTPSPTVEELAVAPEIPAGRIEPVWDPRGAEGLPVLGLGVPRVMESLVPGEVAQPVALLDDGSRARLVSADGLVEDLTLPDGLETWRTVSLSPDGSRLAVTGVSGFFWRTLDGGWQRVDVGDEQQVTGEGVSITWAPDGRSLVLRSHLDGVRVDLDSGERTLLPMLHDHRGWDFAPDGTVVTVTGSVEEWDGEEVADDIRLGPIGNLQRPAVGEASIAGTRGDGSWYGGERGPADRDGLVALERGTLETRAYLPVADRSYWYSDGGHLSAVGWLDDDTVLLTVQPEDAPKEYLLAWDVENGELFRVSCWLRDVGAVFATDLLG